MKKKILIVSRIFSPDNTIGAIRPTKFAKYLSQSGYHVDVVSSKESKYTEDSILVKDTSALKNIIRLSNSRLYQKVRSLFYPKVISGNPELLVGSKVIKGKLNNKFLAWLKGFIKYCILLVDEFDFYRQFKKESIKIDEYDYVFSTYSTYANHLIASNIKRRQKKIKWIADFRDPVFVDTVPFGFRKYTKTFAMKNARSANAITAVSEGTLENLYISKYSGVKRVITNGFDREDLNCDKSNEVFDKFTFTYTGQLYGGKRDLSVLFKMLNELIQSNEISKSDIQLCYAGSSLKDLIIQASKYKLTDILVDSGYINRRDALHLQKKSHILVLSSWNKKNNTGVVTGKLLEYMMMEKPVVSFINGDIANSRIKEIVVMCNLGIVYEEANDSTDYGLMKEYILKKYNEYKHSGSINHFPVQQEIDKYSYKKISNQLMELMEEIE